MRIYDFMGNIPNCKYFGLPKFYELPHFSQRLTKLFALFFMHLKFWSILFIFAGVYFTNLKLSGIQTLKVAEIMFTNTLKMSSKK